MSPLGGKRWTSCFMTIFGFLKKQGYYEADLIALIGQYNTGFILIIKKSKSIFS